MMRHAAFTFGALLLGVAALWHATDGFRAVTGEGARRVQIAAAPAPVPPVAVETMTGAWHRLDRQGPALVEFIYTTCPTICQTSGGDFAELRDHLRDAGLSVPMYSISFDPGNDDLPALQEYADAHRALGDPWTVARPRSEDLPVLLDTFRVTVIPDDWGGYQHNIAVLLINGDGAFAGVFDTRAFDDIRHAVDAAL